MLKEFFLDKTLMVAANKESFDLLSLASMYLQKEHVPELTRVAVMLFSSLFLIKRGRL